MVVLVVVVMGLGKIGSADFAVTDAIYGQYNGSSEVSQHSRKYEEMYFLAVSPALAIVC